MAVIINGVKIDGSVISGKSISVSNGEMIINGQKFRQDAQGNLVIVMNGEPPEPPTKTEYDHITTLVLSSENTRLSKGDKFKSEGYGKVRRSGNIVYVDDFSGDIALPELESFKLTVRNGDLNGEINSHAIDVRNGNGTVQLEATKRTTPMNIEVKNGNGSVRITVN